MLDCSITCLEEHPTNRNWFICLVYWYNVQGDVVEILQGICLDVVVFLHLEMHNVNDYRLYIMVVHKCSITIL